MRKVLARTLATGLLVAVPAMMSVAPASAYAAKRQAAAHRAQGGSAPAQPNSKGTSGTREAKPAAAATHSSSGIVASVSDTSLVITHNRAKKPVEMRFTMDPSTQREGNVAVGQRVSVRYRNEGSTHVATAVKAQAAKAAHARKSK